MNAARQICTVHQHTFSRNLFRKFRFSSRNYKSSLTSQPQVQEEKFAFEDMQVLERADRRKPPIPPFMKNVFVSIFNRDLLAFPEVMNKEETEDLERRVEAIQAVFSDDTKTKEDRREVLKRTRMFAAPASLTNNGLALNCTESLRYLDVIGEDFELGQEVSDHWVALEALQAGLTEEQYSAVVGDLTSGEHTVALCIKERVAERLTQPDFRSTAEMDGQGIWRISGEKVCNHVQGYQLVLASLEGGRLKAFLVHPGVQGVRYEGGFVHFLNTPATPLDLVAEPALAQILAKSRLHAAALCRVRLQRAARAIVHYVKPRAFSGKPLSELPTIRATLGDTLLDIYTAESMQYFTAGIVDSYRSPDAELELAMCRNFMATHAPPRLLSLLAIPALDREEQCREMLDDVLTLLARGETLDSVNMFIAMTAIQHAGKTMHEEIKQIRNPLMHPAFIIKKALANRHQERDAPALSLRLREALHPRASGAAELLEYGALRLRFGAEALLARRGAAAPAAATELSRLAAAGTEVLAMTAVLARASRAYCIGLRNAEVEMKLSTCFVEKSKGEVQRLIREIDDGEYLNLDRFRVEFGKKFLDDHSFLVEKPTARVFW